MQKELGVELPFFYVNGTAEEVQASLWRYSRHFQLGEDLRADAENAGGMTFFIWQGNTQGSPKKS